MMFLSVNRLKVFTIVKCITIKFLKAKKCKNKNRRSNSFTIQELKSRVM